MLDKKKPDTVEIVKQQQAKIGLAAYGNMQPHKGHTIFEYNMITEELCVAEIKPPEMAPAKFERLSKKTKSFDDFAKEPKTVGTIIMHDDCIYLSALNKPNAIKLLLREHGIQYKIKTA